MPQFFECLFIEAMHKGYRHHVVKHPPKNGKYMNRAEFLVVLRARLDMELEHRPLIKVAQN